MSASSADSETRFAVPKLLDLAVARVIDGMLTLCVSVVVLSMVAGTAIRVNEADSTVEITNVAVFIATIAGTFLVYPLYDLLVVSLLGRTLGMKVRHLALVRYSSGAELDRLDAFKRAALPLIAMSVAFIGSLTGPVIGTLGMFAYLAIYTSGCTDRAEHRGWHDQFAGTIVILENSVDEDAASEIE